MNPILVRIGSNTFFGERRDSQKHDDFLQFCLDAFPTETLSSYEQTGRGFLRYFIATRYQKKDKDITELHRSEYINKTSVQVLESFTKTSITQRDLRDQKPVWQVYLIIDRDATVRDKTIPLVEYSETNRTIIKKEPGIKKEPVKIKEELVRIKKEPAQNKETNRTPSPIIQAREDENFNFRQLSPLAVRKRGASKIESPPIAIRDTLIHVQPEDSSISPEAHAELAQQEETTKAQDEDIAIQQEVQQDPIVQPEPLTRSVLTRSTRADTDVKMKHSRQGKRRK